jgi:hypothetical protein
MAGHDPAIHVFLALTADVDARVEPAHGIGRYGAETSPPVIARRVCAEAIQSASAACPIWMASLAITIEETSTPSVEPLAPPRAATLACVCDDGQR